MLDKLSHYFSHPGFGKYFKNFSWIIFGRFFVIIVSFVVSAYVARYLGPSNSGLLAFAISFVGLFSAFIHLGIDTVLYRELIERPKDEPSILGAAFLLKLIGSIVSIFLSYITLLFIPHTDISWVLILMLSLTSLFQSLSVLAPYFGARVLSKYTIVATIITTIILSLGKLGVIYFDKGVIYFTAVLALEPVLYALCYVIGYQRLTNFGIRSWTFSKQAVLYLLTHAWPLFFSGVFTLVYARIDQIMLKMFIDTKSVGLYDASVRIAEAWIFLPSIIITSLFPALLNARKTDPTMYQKRVIHLWWLVVGVSVVIATGIALFKDQIMYIVFGNQFIEASTSLTIYCFAGVGTAINIFIQNILIAEYIRKPIFWGTLGGMLLNIALNFYLIPTYGINGAATATLISYFVSPLISLCFKDCRERLRIFTN